MDGLFYVVEGIFEGVVNVKFVDVVEELLQVGLSGIRRNQEFSAFVSTIRLSCQYTIGKNWEDERRTGVHLQAAYHHPVRLDQAEASRFFCRRYGRRQEVHGMEHASHL